MPSHEWSVSPTPEFIRSSHAYEKKHPDELAATLANLFHRYLPRLNHARRHDLVHAGCLHHEGHGVIAIDQSGHGKSLSETRLYAYPHDESLTLHLLLIADKSSQTRPAYRPRNPQTNPKLNLLMAKLTTPLRSSRYRNAEDLRRAGIISPEIALRIRAAGVRTKVITDLVCQRLSAGLSQKDVARRMDRTQSWVSKFEDRLDAELTLGDIQAYCQAIAGGLALEFGRRVHTAA